MTDKRNDLPTFARIYQANLSKDRKLKVTIIGRTQHYDLLPNIDKIGQIDQFDGKWTIFDPDDVADKIIDPQLVPEVQKLCSEINAADKKYRENKPSEFTDESGTTWVRKP